jgi:hypothetical protein
MVYNKQQKDYAQRHKKRMSQKNQTTGYNDYYKKMLPINFHFHAAKVGKKDE